ncbi:MAG: type II toxin-antitoxin system PemK/MazF family toxin [Ilumatobacter sp.]|uniref:type II toxin-antitoxin system PemK/MazF family toxin n=1 Tax=Ilumatobacter sp. TaxID=1967498 RepID=UPI002637944C|nr:type II toxin-antitoxin system PemK/MazF family toxin [Ilumatobacter sp.]MDJ0769374.1 type II toxin-antitoxin system PemK/MazF family toxin [Ilumatobacter sp.]
MPRKIDIGGYFEGLTQRARGGRRLDDSIAAGEPTNRSGRSRSGRSVRETIEEALDKGRKRAGTRRRRPAPAPKRVDRLPPEGVVAIEYSPRLDGDPDPGEVVWTWVPFEEDPEQGKDRPVVVVGRRGRKLVGVPLTTKRSGREAQIAIGKGGWDPKRRNSYARIWRMLDLDPDRMRREGAVLERRRFDDVVAAVDEYYDVHYTDSVADDIADDDFDYEY